MSIWKTVDLECKEWMVKVSAKMLNAEMVIMGIRKTVDLKCKEWIVKVSEKNCAHWTNGRFDQTEKRWV